MYAAVYANRSAIVDPSLINLLKRVAGQNVTLFSTFDPDINDIVSAYNAGLRFRSMEVAYDVDNQRHSTERVAILTKRKQLKPERFIGEVRYFAGASGAERGECVGYNRYTNTVQVKFHNETYDIPLKEWKSRAKSL